MCAAVAHCKNFKLKEGTQQEWLTRLKTVRAAAKTWLVRVQKAADDELSKDDKALLSIAGVLDLRLTLCECSINALPEDHAHEQLMRAGLNLAIGVGKAALTGGSSGAKEIGNAVSSVFNMGKRYVEGRVAESLSIQLRVIDVEIEARTRPITWRWARPVDSDDVESVTSFHTSLMWTLFALEKAVLDTAPRWEIAAHYVSNLKK